MVSDEIYAPCSATGHAAVGRNSGANAPRSAPTGKLHGFGTASAVQSWLLGEATGQRAVLENVAVLGRFPASAPGSCPRVAGRLRAAGDRAYRVPPLTPSEDARRRPTLAPASDFST